MSFNLVNLFQAFTSYKLVHVHVCTVALLHRSFCEIDPQVVIQITQKLSLGFIRTVRLQTEKYVDCMWNYLKVSKIAYSCRHDFNSAYIHVGTSCGWRVIKILEWLNRDVDSKERGPMGNAAKGQQARQPQDVVKQYTELLLRWK